MANLLGRSLKYFVDAFDFARRGSSASRRQNPIATRILANASRSGQTVSQANVDYFAQLAVTNPSFMAGMDKIGNRLGDPGNIITQRKRSGSAGQNSDGDDESLWEDWLDHQFLQVIASPNAFVPGFLMLQETGMWMNTYGNAYWFLATDELGVGPVHAIYHLPANMCYPDPTTLRISHITGNLTIDYRYTMGSQMLLPGENVVHFRTPNLFNYWQGMAKLSSLQQSLQMDIGESNYLNSFFEESNAVPSSIISVPREVTDDEMRVIERDLQEQFGAKRATLVTRAGEMDAKVIQHTIEEMQVLDGMNFNGRRIQDVLGIPTGLSNAASGTARLAAEIAFAKDVIQPMLTAMASFLHAKVTPMYALPGQMRIVAKNIIPQDTAIAIAEYQAYRPDETINGNRKKQNLKPLILTGDLAKFQQYLDEVPLEILEILLTAKLSEGQPQVMGAGMGMAQAATAGAEARFGNTAMNAARIGTNAPQRRRGMTSVSKFGSAQEEVQAMLKTALTVDELETLNRLM